jgi:hypothetical protein
MNRIQSSRFGLVLALFLTGTSATQAVQIIGLTNNPGAAQGVVIFDSAAPGTILSSASLTGLASGESLLSIDARPAGGAIYGLSSASKLYTINTTTGALSQIGSGFTTPLSGTSVGFDFNPTIDRIRIVSDADQNIVGHPLTGNANVASPTPVAVFYAAGDPNVGANPNVVHHAYDRNFVGGVTSQLRAIDTNLDILVTQANNAGTLGTIGPLGINATDVGGFDIGASGGSFAAFNFGGASSTLYRINLATGAATSIGSIPAVIAGITVIPEPSAIAIGFLAIGGLWPRRR